MPSTETADKNSVAGSSKDDTNISSTISAKVDSIKQARFPGVTRTFDDLDCTEQSQGYWITDLKCLNDARNLHLCQGAALAVIDTGNRSGLYSTLAFMCLKCGEKQIGISQAM